MSTDLPCSLRGHLSPAAARSRCRRSAGSGPRPAFWTRRAPGRSRVGNLRRVVAVLEHDEAQRVDHRVRDTDLPFSSGSSKAIHRGYGFGVVLVPGDAVHPGGRVEPVSRLGWNGGCCLRRDEVLDVRIRLLSSFSAQCSKCTRRGKRSLSVEDDDVAADALALREPALHLREVTRVVVDLLVVVDLDPGLLRELLEVVGPVGPRFELSAYRRKSQFEKFRTSWSSAATRSPTATPAAASRPGIPSEDATPQAAPPQQLPSIAGACDRSSASSSGRIDDEGRFQAPSDGQPCRPRVRRKAPGLDPCVLDVEH